MENIIINTLINERLFIIFTLLENILYKAWWKNIRVERERFTYDFHWLEKNVYDNISREIIWKVLEKKRELMSHISALSDIYIYIWWGYYKYEDLGKSNKEFSIQIGLHQDSSLSPYIFTLVLDILTKHIQDTVLKCMFFCKWYSSYRRITRRCQL